MALRSAGTRSRRLRFQRIDPQDEASPNPLDVDEWRFLVVSTERIAEAYGDQKSVRLSRVQEIEEAVSYWELGERVDLELREGT